MPRPTFEELQAVWLLMYSRASLLDAMAFLKAMDAFSGCRFLRFRLLPTQCTARRFEVLRLLRDVTAAGL
jgi:hypothetical protein